MTLRLEEFEREREERTMLEEGGGLTGRVELRLHGEAHKKELDGNLHR